jgi:hypothetical protein
MCLLPSVDEPLPRALGVAEATGATLPLNERTLAAIWNAQRPLHGPFWTTRGEPVAIVYRGRWMGGPGPDFQNAILSLGGGRPQRGDIELHLRAGDWYAHGHHTDPAYNNVLLHVVYTLGSPARGITTLDEARPAVTAGGRTVPTLVLAPHLDAPPGELAALQLPDLGDLSEEPCWERTMGRSVADLQAVINRAGLARLAEKAARYEADLTVATADLPPYEAEAAADQILYAGLCDALGYSANRAPFRALAARLPLRLLHALAADRPAADRQATLEAALLGAAGLLPGQRQAARDLDWESAAQAEELERQWRALRPQIAGSGAADPVPLGWQFAGVRPPNAPARRVAALAYLLTWLLPQGVTTSFVADAAAAPDPATLRARWQARLRVAAPGGFWAEHSDFGTRLPGRKDAASRGMDLIGADRAADMLVNIVAPFCVAWANLTGHPTLVAAATAVYETHPPLEENQITRAMRDEVFGPRAKGAITTACQQQGLIACYGRTCAERRIYECPLSGVGRGRKFED